MKAQILNQLGWESAFPWNSQEKQLLLVQTLSGKVLENLILNCSLSYEQEELGPKGRGR